MTTLLRFAPSPTGRLHLGNIRTALINWLYAKKLGGRLLLRIDDTDRERSRADYETAIRHDLLWLGLNWDLEARQSARLDRYAEAASRLKEQGRLYPSYETAEELELKRKLALSRGKPPIYDRAALKLSPQDIAAYEARGVQPAWRFKLNEGQLAWQDLVRGQVQFDAALMSDPVLIRPDGAPVYMLASVVDDIELGMTTVIRGEDHVANTAIQIQLFEALGGTVPEFGHFSLIADASGEKLSKRTGSSSIEDLREAGIEPQAILSLLAKLGTSDPIELRAGLETLVDEFDLTKFGRNRPKLDEHELMHLNAKLMHELTFDQVKDRLPPGADAPFWDAVRGNLARVADAEQWWNVVALPLAPVIEDPAFLRQAATLLPPAPFDQNSWAHWTGAVKGATGYKGKALFHPLRLALTGRETGPELAKLLPLMPYDRVMGRLEGRVA